MHQKYQKNFQTKMIFFLKTSKENENLKKQNKQQKKLRLQAEVSDDPLGRLEDQGHLPDSLQFLALCGGSTRMVVLHRFPTS